MPLVCTMIHGSPARPPPDSAISPVMRGDITLSETSSPRLHCKLLYAQSLILQLRFKPVQVCLDDLLDMIVFNDDKRLDTVICYRDIHRQFPQFIRLQSYPCRMCAGLPHMGHSRG